MKVYPKFTLLELLIVVAIIAILTSMLLPALGKARRAAYLSGCGNNQKQLYLGMAQYDSDNGELPPLYTDVSGCQPKWNIVGWNGMGMLYSTGYITNGLSFYCPSPQNMVQTPADRKGQCGYNGRPNGVYGWKYAIKNDHWLMNNYWFRWCGVSINHERSDANLAEMRSKLSLNSPNRWMSSDTWGRWIFTSPEQYWMAHGNGFNVLFIDGHVQFFKATHADLVAGYPDQLIPKLTGNYGNSQP